MRTQKIIWLIAVAYSATALAQQPKPLNLPKNDWKVTREQYEPEVPRGLRQFADEYQLICESLDATIESGQSARFFVGVKRTANGLGTDLLNPFSESTFPSSLCLVVFDENNKYVAALPQDQPEKPEDASLFLHGGELRGRYIEVRTDRTGDQVDPFFVALQPGKYRFVLVTRLRLFKPAMVHAGLANLHPTDEIWWKLQDFEVCRSKTATLLVIPATNKARGSEESDPHEGRLLAEVSIERNTQDNAAAWEVWLRLTNTSKSNSIGAIDPYCRHPRVADRPIKWTLRGFGSNANLAADGFVGNPMTTNDIVVIPPQGVVFAKAAPANDNPGRFEASVDLSKGLICDQVVLERLLSRRAMLRTDTLEPNPNMIHKDSKLTQRIVAE